MQNNEKQSAAAPAPDQQPVSPINAAMNTMAAQRNAAMDEVCRASAAIAELQVENAALKVQLEKAKKAAEDGKDNA